MAQHMVKVSVEVRSSAARFRVSVQAESIRKALGMVKARYPQGEVGVHFPIEPEGFFVDAPPPWQGCSGWSARSSWPRENRAPRRDEVSSIEAPQISENTFYDVG